jgi:hypothetical protein
MTKQHFTHAGLVHVGAVIVAATLLGSIIACDNNPIVPTSPGSSGSPVTSVTVRAGASAGSTIPLTAMATRADGTTNDVTTRAQWQSSNVSVASVEAGTVTVLSTGEVEILAAFESVTGSLRLIVSEPPVASREMTGGGSSGVFQLTAIARSPDGSTRDVTRSAAWESSDITIASVSLSGLVTVVGNGDVVIRASYRGVTGARTFTVSVPRMAVLSGLVRAAPTGTPVVGAAVRILNGVTGMTLTDVSGRFVFKAVPQGRVLVEVMAPGYLVYETSLILTGDMSVVLELTPTPPPTTQGRRPTR